ncbi:MAG: 3'-5' exonuclease [Bacteroidales bacterium]|nr:3'-5' exonuclease [Lentimicrobiaceae bacterium]MDD5694834.1 3'-5' exonuclease [Bacteroidales bacterium]
MELKLTRPLAFFDLETTGTDIATDRIVEISILKLFPDGTERIKTHLINPTVPIPEEVTRIHGINDEKVRDKPTFAELAGDLAAFIASCDLAGYNIIKFDIPLLAEEFLRAEIDFDLRNRRIIDVQNIFHKMEPRTLKAAYKFYCAKDLVDAHSAEADTLASAEVLKAQLDLYQHEPYTDIKGNTTFPIVNDMEALSRFSFYTRYADLAGHIIYNDQGKEIFNFGKYKGKIVEEVFQIEPQYYDWMMKSAFPLYTKKIITAIKMREFNKGNARYLIND